MEIKIENDLAEQSKDEPIEAPASVVKTTGKVESSVVVEKKNE